MCSLSARHEPAWGNLIFVPNKDTDKFSTTLQTYLNKLKKAYTKAQIRENIKKIPGSRALYSLIKGR